MKPFQFKHFSVQHSKSAMKIGTDAMVLGALCQFENCQRLMDIGTGTGVLSLIAAQRFQIPVIDALEIEEKACLDAGENFKNHPFVSKINLIHGDARDFTSAEKYDGIISNPPFYEGTSLSGNAERDLARHSNEFDFESLVKVVVQNLSTDGQFWCILPFAIIDGFVQLANENGLFLNIVIQINGKPRTPVRGICSFTHSKNEKVNHSEFTIRDADGSYTQQYIQATIELHDRAL